MTDATLARQERLHHRGIRLEVFTIAWNVVEAFVAIGVGLVVGSVALVGFGVDSGIEVISAVALLWRLFRAPSRLRVPGGTPRIGGPCLRPSP